VKELKRKGPDHTKAIKAKIIVQTMTNSPKIKEKLESDEAMRIDYVEHGEGISHFERSVLLAKDAGERKGS